MAGRPSRLVAAARFPASRLEAARGLLYAGLRFADLGPLKRLFLFPRAESAGMVGHCARRLASACQSGARYHAYAGATGRAAAHGRDRRREAARSFLGGDRPLAFRAAGAVPALSLIHI